MALSCLRAGSLLGREAATLSEAERLVLEEHLEHCAACRRESRFVDGLREAVRIGLPRAMPAAARERLVERVLAREDAAPRIHPSVLPRRAVFAAAAAVLALTALVLVRASVWTTAHEAPPAEPLRSQAVAVKPAPVERQHAPEAEAARDGDALRVERGAVSAGTGRWTDGDAPARTALSATSPSRLRVRHAALDLDAGAVVSWVPERGVVELRDGRLEVAVDPGPRQPFSVATARFRVDVIGTRFIVDASSVHVIDGRVRVVLPEGTTQDVEPGEHWRLPEEPDTRAHEAPASPSRAAADSPGKPTTAPESAATPPDEESARAPAPSVKSLLDEARQELAAGSIGAAREQVSRALASGPSRREEAEARTLLAECAQRSGNRSEAARLYERVASTFPDLMAGQTALYAAARSYETTGNGAMAKSTLRRYLSQYPTGRFHKEATRRLAALEAR
jgi:TolA-binding protein